MNGRSVSFLFLYATIYRFHVKLRLTQTNDLQSGDNKLTEHIPSVIPGRRDVFVFSAFGIHSDNEHMSRSNNDTVSFISVVDMESPVRDNKCSPNQKESPPPTTDLDGSNFAVIYRSHVQR